MRGLVIMVVWLAVLPASASAGDPPRRVISINLCADQLLVLLAPETVVSLTALATDPAFSPVAEEAKRYAVNHGRIEEIVSSAPDLVLAGPYTAPATLELTRRRGIPIAIVGMPEDFDGIRAVVRDTAAALGVSGKGEALIAGMERELATVPAVVGRRPRVLAWQPGGFTAGRGTLTDAVLTAAGFANAAAEAGMTGYGYLSLETVVADPPDLLIAEAETPERPSLREALLQHPALSRLRRPGNTAEVPLMSCGGPFTARAVTRLAELRK